MGNTAVIVRELRRRLNAFNVDVAIQNSDNEAKTRMYLIEEFFLILGYNRGFDNGYLVPEYNADFADMKGKKVDYAILFRNKPEIIIEAKDADTKLKVDHLRQLNEYFNNTNDSKIGVLTNGIEYQFYCRNKNGNKGLHPTPFYTFDLKNIEGNSIEKLAELHPTVINVTQIIDDAQELFFIESFEEALYKELSKPSKEFIKVLNTHMGSKKLNENLENQLRGLINSVSLKGVLDKLIIEEASKANSGIITTQDEMKAYHVIKTILAQHKKIDTKSIGFKDQKGKFSVIIDGNLKKKVCDLYITSTAKRIEIDGEKYDIPDIDSIVKLKKTLTDKALGFFEST
jgi:hypothetical protein